MDDKSSMKNYENPFDDLESELKLEEYKRVEVLSFCKKLIDSIKQSVDWILNNQEFLSDQGELLEESTEIKRNINEYSFLLLPKDEEQIKALNKDISFLIDELERLNKEIQEINMKILSIDKNRPWANLFELTYSKDRRKLINQIWLKNTAIDKLYEYKIALFKKNM